MRSLLAACLFSVVLMDAAAQDNDYTQQLQGLECVLAAQQSIGPQWVLVLGKHQGGKWIWAPDSSGDGVASYKARLFPGGEPVVIRCQYKKSSGSFVSGVLSKR